MAAIHDILLCFAVVAGSVAASLWARTTRRRRPHPADPTEYRAAAMASLAGVLIATLFSAYGCFIYSRSHHRVTTLPESDESVLSNSLMEINHGADHHKEGAVLYLGSFMQIIYQVLGGAVVLTDVVFWALIVPFMYSAHFSLNAVMGCIHSLNLVFLLIETTLNSLKSIFQLHNFPAFKRAGGRTHSLIQQHHGHHYDM
uniref:Uncharacterized protein n=1 Tax=Leersia perrieri TaxID=77586 RepID=A0A0D9UZY8_9ORYZ